MVQPGTPLEKFNEIIYALMGWSGSHSHQFHKSDGSLISNEGLDENDVDDSMDVLQEEDLALDDILEEKGDTLDYTYDLDNSWHLIITLKDIKPMKADEKYPQLVGGKRAVPPESATESERDEYNKKRNKYDNEHIERQLAKFHEVPYPSNPVARNTVASNAVVTGPRVYKVEIELGRRNPKVCRHLMVRPGTTLKYFDKVIRAVMGWSGYHVSQFTGTKRISEGEFSFTTTVTLKGNLTLDTILKKKGDTLEYTYDLGDNWDHLITLKDIKPLKEGVVYPQLIGGRAAVPPEDGSESDYERYEMNCRKYDKERIERRLTKLLEKSQEESEEEDLLFSSDFI